MSRIEDNLARVLERIAQAARRSGRPPESVQLVAVTKYMDVQQTRKVVEAGCRDLGESRPQQLWSKAEQLSDLSVRWHLVGHLQRNKIARTLPLIHLLHSADSWRLLEALEEFAARQDCSARVLLEVNISGESAKHGFEPDELPALMPRLAELSRVQVQGLMGMAGLDADDAATRRQFRRLRQLRDALEAERPPNVQLDTLSMGMSRDYEIAVEEGATLVRVGSALVEED